jgi:hypothetical protein
VDGKADGSNDGDGLGSAVGNELGVLVGWADGDAEGPSDGSDEAATEGLAEGSEVNEVAITQSRLPPSSFWNQQHLAAWQISVFLGFLKQSVKKKLHAADQSIDGAAEGDAEGVELGELDGW